MGANRRAKGWIKLGCAGAGLLVLVLIIAGAVFLGVLWKQAHAMHVPLEDEVRTFAPPSTAAGVSRQTRLRVVLQVAVADVVVVPAPPGEPARVEARFDPRRFELKQTSQATGDGAETLHVHFAPRGSKALALLRLKLGGEISHLRITLPLDAVVQLEGRLSATYGAMELGGLALEATDLRLDDGAVSLSFAEPLQAPMQRLSIQGRRGAVEVTTLGNASPAEARFRQRLGAIDLDLRGPWSRDAQIVIEGRVAGGSIWLPRDVNIEGLDPGRFRAPAEVPRDRPTLDLTLSSRVGQLIVVE